MNTRQASAEYQASKTPAEPQDKKSPTNSDGNQNVLARLTQKRWWPWLVNAAKCLFFVLVSYLLIKLARSVEWQQVFDTMQERPLHSLLLAALLSLCAYALYGSFDLLGRHLTGHTLPGSQVVGISMICYAFNFNLGATVGGAAFRFRLYSRCGLNIETVARVLITSTLTNWLGYFFLGGLIFCLHPLDLPPDWKIDSTGLRYLGGAMFVLALGYLALCAYASGRSWTIRGYDLTVPSLRFALLQLAMSSATWASITGVAFVLLDQQIAFTDVLCVLMIAAIAGIMTHVPGGLGVIEAVFVALLSHQMARNDLIASVLMFRVIYYLIPLVLATIGYLTMEARIKRKT